MTGPWPWPQAAARELSLQLQLEEARRDVAELERALELEQASALLADDELLKLRLENKQLRANHNRDCNDFADTVLALQLQIDELKNAREFWMQAEIVGEQIKRETLRRQLQDLWKNEELIFRLYNSASQDGVRKILKEALGG